MDWHTQKSQYTFNRSLVPDPSKFMSWLHGSDNSMGHPLKYLVNLHPNGVSSDEDKSHYEDFLRRMGYGPGSKPWDDRSVKLPCALNNRTYANAYFESMLRSSPSSGIDHWWTDWGGCGSPRPKGTPPASWP